jgi:ankyrin repeat protein
LVIAAHCGHHPIVRYLLNEGAEVNDRDGYGSLALRWASTLGRVATLQLLLEAGADAVSPGRIGETPLIQAARAGHVGVARALLAHGCGDVDTRDERVGSSALCWACLRGQTDVARLLLEAGADTRLETREGWRAMDLARHEGHGECMALLQVRRQGQTRLVVSCICRHLIQSCACICLKLEKTSCA